MSSDISSAVKNGVCGSSVRMLAAALLPRGFLPVFSAYCATQSAGISDRFWAVTLDSLAALRAASANKRISGPASPSRYAASTSKYVSLFATRAEARGTTTCEVAPRRLKTVLINALPIRPFPSVKGWIDSNWAWTMAA